MQRIQLWEWLTVFIIALAIATGFFLDGKTESFTNLSSDQYNILTVCLKKDNPEIFKGDLVADNYEDVAYYTPFFVDSLRFFASLNDGDYLAGFNWLNFILNILFIVCWFALFRQFLSFPLAVIFALLSKGIMWPPGNEVWGMHSLWTLLPRSIFQIAMAVVLICWWRIKKMPGLLLAAFFAGITVNFHPISGLGLVCAIAFLNLEIFWNQERDLLKRIGQYFGTLIASIAGMVPFMLTYITNVQEKEVVAFEEFYQFMILRIPNKFFRTFGLFNELLEAKWILFIWLPLAAILGLYYFRDKLKITFPFRLIWMIGGLYFAFIAASLAPYPLEEFLNNLGFKGRFAFQLGRNLKYLILPAYLSMALILSFGTQKAAEKFNVKTGKINYGVLSAFLLILILSKTLLQPVPLLGDDIFKTILPNSMSMGEHNPFSGDENMDEMMAYIADNTDVSAKFVAPAVLRVATKRSVVFDYKGASMLIEGNPSKYLIWAKQAVALRDMDVLEQADQYHEMGADYWLINEQINLNFEPEKVFGKWHLYKLR